MKILHTVQFYRPTLGGMQEAVGQVSERLVRKGHEVTVATGKVPGRSQKPINGVRVVEFEVDGNLAEGFSGEVDRYRNFLLNSEFDIITNFAAQQWATDVMLTVLDRISAKKAFVPTGFSGLFMAKYHDYFQSMKSWLKQYDANIFLSDDYRDIEFARKHGVDKIYLIPNGASAEEFLADPTIDIREKFKIPKKHFLIFHVGSHTAGKGHSEAIKIFGRAKIENATFLLVGNKYAGCTFSCQRKQFMFSCSPKRLTDKKRLLVTTLSRPETVAAYHAADLFLFPSQIECSPLVLYECLASKTAFLTTEAGNAAEIIRWSGSGQLLPTIRFPNGYCRADVEKSVPMLEHLYHQPKLREKMEANGFSAWQKRFTWEKIAEDYESLYCQILKANKAGV